MTTVRHLIPTSNLSCTDQAGGGMRTSQHGKLSFRETMAILDAIWKTTVVRHSHAARHVDGTMAGWQFPSGLVAEEGV